MDGYLILRVKKHCTYLGPAFGRWMHRRSDLREAQHPSGVNPCLAPSKMRAFRNQRALLGTVTKPAHAEHPGALGAPEAGKTCRGSFKSHEDLPTQRLGSFWAATAAV